MSDNLYIFKSGRLKRQGNTLLFKNDEVRKSIPVETKKEIYLFGEVTLNTKLFNFLSQKNIVVHIFNHYGFYSGTYHPREYQVSGNLLIKQVEHYQSNGKRLELARSFIEGAIFNIKKNLIHYNRTHKEIQKSIDEIERYYENLENVQTIEELMGLEANVRKLYYSTFQIILGEKYQMKKRVIRPPDNPINCLLSFGNSLVYTSCLSQIYRTALNPTISYLHSAGTRRFSLSLDIAEIFKPILSERIVFKLLNSEMIQEKHFTKKLNFCHLNDEGRELFLKEFDEKLQTTVYLEKLKRKVSYRRLIRLECYKLVKHLLEGEKYEPLHFIW